MSKRHAQPFELVAVIHSGGVLQLLADDRAPAKARAVVNDALGDDERAGPAMLATSEIVTNALLHSSAGPDQTIELLVTTRQDGVIIAISTDAAAALTQVDLEAAAREPPTVGGWGLVIVAAVSRRWGVEHQEERVSVWFEI